ncbi:methyl-accepting chemotaxis protein [Yunchengibacter salinarum]|uniref:methyl-accepting chemotaxis protein n=1 Tax=Yunchengibacter salinarum TaxID=3133399 RepID=UPI0035B62638
MDQEHTSEARLANLETYLAALESGEAGNTPDDPLARRIDRLLAARSGKEDSQARDRLRRTVTIAVGANKGVTRVARLMRTARQVDDGAQSIAAASEELVQSVSEIAENASQATAEAEQASSEADTGRQSAHTAVDTMNSVASGVAEAVTKVNRLAEASVHIGDIVDTIDGIAGQTNLLALNATIEAARAGEAGKGFAVVASEVKTLSQQTARATEDIRKRIADLRDEIDGIVTSMGDAEKNARTGQDATGTAGDAIARLAETVDSVKTRMQDVSAILSQQTEAAQEISGTIQSISGQSAETVRTVADAIAALKELDSPLQAGIDSVLEADLPYATLEVAKADHVMWMRKLAEMLAGEMRLNPNELADHHKCRLGQWADRLDDPAITNHPAFQELESPHSEVHRAGIEAAQAYQRGDLATAVDAVDRAGDASARVMALLDRLSGDLFRG